MDIKAYLRQLKRVDSFIRAKLEQQKQAQDMLSQLGPGPFQDKLTEVEQQLQTEIDQLYATKSGIEHAINSVSNADLRLLLRLRYLNSKSYPEIAREMNYSVQWIYTLHKRAICELKEFLKRT